MDKTPDYEKISWFHSINLGNGIITAGRKSVGQLEAEFNRLSLNSEPLQGKRLLDIGCADGFFSLKCEELGADVIGIDGIHRDGLKYVRKILNPKFRYYCIDFLSPSLHELGRFDVILYLGVLYHTMYPFESLLRLSELCEPGGLVFIETDFFNLPGHEDDSTIFYDYTKKVSQDWTSPVFPSIRWIEQTLLRVGFHDVELLGIDWPTALRTARGRVTLRARYRGGRDRVPFLYAGEQLSG
jgi:tRNA (mo5U34)-methyltransferase